MPAVAQPDALARLLRLNERGLGDFGEQVLSNILRASGVRYIPLSKIDRGGAPRIEQANGFTALPDIDAAAAEWTAFVEVKCKSQSVYWRRDRQIRHGIDRVRFHDYERAAEVFKKHCAVAIVELYREDGVTWSGSILIERLLELGPPFDGEGPQRHMVYWRRKDFHDLDSFTPEELWDIHDGRVSRSFELELMQVFARKKQRDLF